MIRKLTVAAFAACVALAPAMSSAQATDPFPSSAPGLCLLTPSIFTSFTPTKCYGFFDQNDGLAGFATGQTVSSSNNTTAYNALLNFGYAAGTYSVVEKIDDGDGTLSFNTTMSGWTVVGIHWGNYPNSLEGSGGSIGNVSAFYLFNAGAGTKNLVLADNQGISNASIISTGGSCNAQTCTPGTFSTVPEPSTYALMTAGLLGIFGVARRRRNA